MGPGPTIPFLIRRTSSKWLWRTMLVVLHQPILNQISSLKALVCMFTIINREWIIIIYTYRTHTRTHTHTHTHTAPEVISGLSLRTDQENQVVYLNWTNSFLLNGILQHYTLTRNNLALLQSADQAISLTTEPRGTRTSAYT